MSTSAMTVEGLKVARGGRDVLNIPALSVQQGEILAVIGPNGAGKSTLLESLALLLPVSMTYTFHGKQVQLPGDALALRRQMAVVFQDPLLLHMSVFDNVAMGLRFRSVSADEIQKRVPLWLEKFGIAHLGKRSAHALSGGEAKRVSMARAFVTEPRVLFLDEPFSALDVITRSALVYDLRKTLRETGVTTLFVSHDFTEVALVADRVAVIVGGQIVQIGTPQELFTKPANDTVRSLVQTTADIVRTLGG